MGHEECHLVIDGELAHSFFDGFDFLSKLCSWHDLAQNISLPSLKSVLLTAAHVHIKQKRTNLAT